MTTKTITEQVLASNHNARNSDKVLIVEVFKRKGWHMTSEEIDMFFKMPSTESIRRTRQKLNENGKYLPDKKVAEYREIKSQEVQQNAPTASPQTLENVLEQRTKVDPWSNS